MLKTDTKYFGEVAYGPEDVLSFPRGLFGFEKEREFLLLPFSGNGTLFCLQSLSEPSLAFVMMDPFSLDPDYNPIPQPDELAELDVTKPEDLAYYVMCVVKDPVSESTVNLRCPVMINDAGISIQVILEDTAYHMRHVLSEFKQPDTSPDQAQEQEQNPAGLGEGASC